MIPRTIMTVTWFLLVMHGSACGTGYQGFMRIPLLLFDGSVEAFAWPTGGRGAGSYCVRLTARGASGTLKPSAVGPAEVPNKNSAPVDSVT